MERSTLVTSKKIKDMETEDLNGKMEENTMDNGLKENSMVLVVIEILREKKDKENGQMEKEHVGWTEIKY